MHKCLSQTFLTVLISACSTSPDIPVYSYYPDGNNCNFIGRVNGTGNTRDKALNEMKRAVINSGGNALRKDNLESFVTHGDFTLTGSAFKCETF